MMNVFENESHNEDGGLHHSMASMPPLKNSSLVVVPNGHIWLEGDNSINSSDSRNYGPVPASLVVGKVLLKLWPLRGNSMIVRGSCPIPPQTAPFQGSTRLPAGYEGEGFVVGE